MFAGVCNEKCSGGKRASDIFPAAGRRVASPLMPPHPGGVDNGFERVCALPSPRESALLRPPPFHPFSLDLSWTFIVSGMLGGEEERRGE